MRKWSKRKRYLLLAGVILAGQISLAAAGNEYPYPTERASASGTEVALDAHPPEQQAITRWQHLIDSSAHLSDVEKINVINRFFNLNVYYDQDLRIWQKADYWATPLETLRRSRGDCEDFSIAKYISLRMLDIPEDKLQLTYVQLQPDTNPKGLTETHMVLAYYPDNQRDPLILDNMNSHILPASARPELKTVFSFNNSMMWVNGQPSRVNPRQRIKHWADVLNRIEKQQLY